MITKILFLIYKEKNVLMTNKIQASFPTLASQVVLSNKNIIEILGKINSLVTTADDSINLQIYDENGVLNSVSVPSFKSLKSDIERLNNNINSLYGIDTNGALIATSNANEYKKIITVDLNREPSTIGSLGKITTFNADNNWFFDNMISPMISVELDLSNKIEDNVRKILSRRYIVNFEKDVDGNFTENALSAIGEFNAKFRGNSNILITDFESWYKTTSGITEPSSPQFDEQVFDLEPNNLKYDGTFTVLKMQEDRINSKLWYVLDKLDYLVRDENIAAQLTIDDELITNTNTTTTKYKIVEVSTSDSNPKIRVERVEGVEPIAIGINTLKIYSPIIYSKKVKISIGYGERDVIFVKAMNVDNNLLAKSWSLGSGFLVSDLTLNSPSTTIHGMSMDKFYTDYVYDYGLAIKDLVAQKIPSSLGVIPDAPTLNIDNFKVVQINKHLTDSIDTNSLKQKYNYQTSLKSELSQIDNDIISKNAKLTSNIINNSTTKQLNTEIAELSDKKTAKTKLLTSLTSEILTLANNLSMRKIEPKYRIRGFWSIPSAIVTTNTTSQEIVQFKIQYRYLNKNGADNTTTMFQYIETQTDGTTVSTTAAYSNWNEYKTDSRSRIYNKENGEYEWEIENTQDADTPNINQLDIPITTNEKVEIRIKSLSEVGFPDAPMESEWSNVITVEFPDDLNNVLDSNDYILQSATTDDLKIQMQQELSSKGIDSHLSDTSTINSVTYYHSASKILSGFKDTNGISLGLYDYLISLQDRIKTLEEKINNNAGELEVIIMRNDQEFVITNGSTTTFNVECEDYLEKYVGAKSKNNRLYANNIYVIKDFVLKIKNVAKSANLDLLSNKTYLQNGNVYNTNVPQVFWVNDNDELLTSDTTLKTYTQIDNQFIWMINYDDVSNKSVTKLSSNIGNSFTNSNSITSILSSSEYNIGYDETNVLTFNGNNKSLLDNEKWIDKTISIKSTDKLLTTIHPVTPTLENIVENNYSKMRTIKAGSVYDVTIPINIYFKMNALDNNQDGINYSYIDLSLTKNINKHIKKIKFLLENENDNKPFTFTIKFNINRNKVVFQKITTPINKQIK